MSFPDELSTKCTADVGSEVLREMVLQFAVGGASEPAIAHKLFPDARQATPLRVDRQNVAGLGFLFEMQFDTADIELTKHELDALFDGGIVSAIAGDKFLDNGPQCCGRQLQMGDAHGVILMRSA